MNRIQKIVLFSLLIILLVVLSLYLFKDEVGNEDGTEHRTIKVGYVPVTTALPLFVAEKEGFFKDKNIEVEIIKFQTANLAVDALIGGRIDATSVIADLPWLSVAQTNADYFRLYAWSILDTDIFMDMILSKKGLDIDEVSDLKGKKLATFPGSQLRLFAEVILKENGLSSADVQIQEMAPPNQIPALISGAVDAIFCLEPICSIALKKDVAQVVVTSPISRFIGGGKPISAASFGISKSFIEKNPELSKEFIYGMWKAIDKINENQHKYRHLFPSFTPVQEPLAKDIPVTIFATAESFDPKLMQKEADILYENGILKSNVDITQLIFKGKQ